MFINMLQSCLLVALVGSAVAKQYMTWVNYRCLNQDLVLSTTGKYLVVSIVGETKDLFCKEIISFPHGTFLCEALCMAWVPLENVTVDQDGKTIKCGPSLFDANRVGDAKYNEFFITAEHVVFDIDIPTTCDVTSRVQIVFARPGSNIKGDENVDKRIKSKITDMTRCEKIETINVGSKYSVALTFEEARNKKEVWEAIKDKTVFIDGAAHSFTSCMKKAEIDDKKEQSTSASVETIAEVTTSTEATSTTTSTTGSTITGTTSTTSTTTEKGSTTKETTPSTSYDILIPIGIAILIVTLSNLILNIFNTFKNGFTQISHQERVHPTDKRVHDPTDNPVAQDTKEDAANTDGIISKEAQAIWGDLTETTEDIMRNKEAEEVPSTVNNSNKKFKKPSCFTTIQVDPEPDQRVQLLTKKLKKPAAENDSMEMISLN